MKDETYKADMTKGLENEKENSRDPYNSLQFSIVKEVTNYFLQHCLVMTQ